MRESVPRELEAAAFITSALNRLSMFHLFVD
jgi:hypothetical protein